MMNKTNIKEQTSVIVNSYPLNGQIIDKIFVCILYQ